MVNIQVRDVPDEVHRALLRKAETAGQSLQQFLTAQLTHVAETPTLDEFIDQMKQHEPLTISFEDVVDAIEAERDRR